MKRLLALALLLPSLAWAATTYWIGVTNGAAASNPASWSGGVVPTNGDDVVFNGVTGQSSNTHCSLDIALNCGMLVSTGNYSAQIWSVGKYHTVTGLMFRTGSFLWSNSTVEVTGNYCDESAVNFQPGAYCTNMWLVVTNATGTVTMRGYLGSAGARKYRNIRIGNPATTYYCGGESAFALMASAFYFHGGTFSNLYLINEAGPGAGENPWNFVSSCVVTQTGANGGFRVYSRGSTNTVNIVPADNQWRHPMAGEGLSFYGGATGESFVFSGNTVTLATNLNGGSLKTISGFAGNIWLTNMTVASYDIVGNAGAGGKFFVGNTTINANELTLFGSTITNVTGASAWNSPYGVKYRMNGCFFDGTWLSYSNVADGGSVLQDAWNMTGFVCTNYDRRLLTAGFTLTASNLIWKVANAANYLSLSNSTVIIKGLLDITNRNAAATSTIVLRGAQSYFPGYFNLSLDTGGTTNSQMVSASVSNRLVSAGTPSSRIVAGVNGALNIQSNAQSYVAFTDFSGSVSNKPVTGYSVWSSNSATGIRDMRRSAMGGL